MVDFTKIVQKSMGEENSLKKEVKPKVEPKKKGLQKQNQDSKNPLLKRVFGELEDQGVEGKRGDDFSEKLGDLFGVEKPTGEE